MPRKRLDKASRYDRGNFEGTYSGTAERMTIMAKKAASKEVSTENTSEKLENDAEVHESNNTSQMQPLMVENPPQPSREVPLGHAVGSTLEKAMADNPEFFEQATKFALCFCGLLISYLTWGYMQELIMTSEFEPTNSAPNGKFPSAAFCVFSNRFLAIIVAMIAVKVRHGAVFSNNVAPLYIFTPCALSNTTSSWSQYRVLRYVSFPVQTVFKSSKIIPVMLMGKLLKNTKYPYSQYVEALLITIGVAIFALASKDPDEDKETQIVGLLFLCLYIFSDSFTSQWQDTIYQKYGKPNVDPYQMMLGVNFSAIIITTTGLVYSGDLPKVYEFFQVNPSVLSYNIITAITSASGQLCIYYTIKEFGPVVFTIIMLVRQMCSIFISAIKFGHHFSLVAIFGASVVFTVLFYQIRRKYLAKKNKAAQQQQEGGDKVSLARDDFTSGPVSK